jgi:hypothetical protein
MSRRRRALVRVERVVLGALMAVAARVVERRLPKRRRPR